MDLEEIGRPMDTEEFLEMCRYFPPMQAGGEEIIEDTTFKFSFNLAFLMKNVPDFHDEIREMAEHFSKKNTENLINEFFQESEFDGMAYKSRQFDEDEKHRTYVLFRMNEDGTVTVSFLFEPFKAEDWGTTDDFPTSMEEVREQAEQIPVEFWTAQNDPPHYYFSRAVMLLNGYRTAEFAQLIVQCVRKFLRGDLGENDDFEENPDVGIYPSLDFPSGESLDPIVVSKEEEGEFYIGLGYEFDLTVIDE